tara:strand:+ start:2408 stop:2533 length:126 start_codon:yes stop_codon:yes gene_type:complete
MGIVDAVVLTVLMIPMPCEAVLLVLNDLKLYRKLRDRFTAA